jgi:hypothetical protein
MIKEISLYIYAWAMAMFFGAILSETVLLYPNIFYDVPDSLTQAISFMKVIGPGDFLPKLGGAIMLFAIFTIVVNLRNRSALKYILASFILMGLFEFLFSVLYFWPRNKIMFTEGIARHSGVELKRVAIEFQLGHVLRLSFSCITSCLACVGLYKSNKEKQNSEQLAVTIN